MARVILEGMGDNVTVGGNDVDVIGTSNDETITIVSGNVTLDASFANGGDTIELAGEAEEYTAALSGSRVIITNVATGATVSIPVGTAGLDVEFGGDDTRSLMVMNGAVMFGEQTVTSTAVTLEAGSETEDSLTTALNNLQSAQTALSEFLEDNDLGAADPTPGDATTAADIRTNEDNALAALNNDVQMNGSDAQLNANLSDARDDLSAAQNAVNNQTGLSAAISELELSQDAYQEARADFVEADGNFDAEVAAYGTRSTITVDVTLNTASDYNMVGAGVTIVSNGPDNTGSPLIVTDANGNIVAGAGAPASGTANYAAFQALLADTRAAFAEAEDLATAQTEFNSDIQAVVVADGGTFTAPATNYYTEATGELNGNFALDADSAARLFEEREDLADAQEAIADRQELRSDYADAQDLTESLETLEQNVTDAEDAIEDLGFETPVTVSEDTNGFGTVDSDIFVLNTETMAGGDAEATISAFGNEGDDILFIGTDYTLVQLEDGDVLATSNQGDVNTLEMFIQQDGNDTVIYFESDSFDGNSSDGSFEGFTLTLTGVDASTVSYDATGYISIEEMPMA